MHSWKIRERGMLGTKEPNNGERDIVEDFHRIHRDHETTHRYSLCIFPDTAGSCTVQVVPCWREISKYNGGAVCISSRRPTATAGSFKQGRINLTYSRLVLPYFRVFRCIDRNVGWHVGSSWSLMLTMPFYHDRPPL